MPVIARIRDWRNRRIARQVTPEAARLRVLRGAAYLDEADPGWHRRIDPATLTLADGSCCVLGQLHGAFRQGLFRAGLLNASSAPRANLSPVRFGFLCVATCDPHVQAQDYTYLDRAWREEIRARQERDGLFGEGPSETGLLAMEEEPSGEVVLV